MIDHPKQVRAKQLTPLRFSHRGIKRFLGHNRTDHLTQKGFALPIVMGMGMVMMVMGLTAIIVAQSDRTTAFQRKQTNSSLAASEGGLARTLAQMTLPNNAVLLTRNYDTINPRTGKTYLGARWNAQQWR